MSPSVLAPTRGRLIVSCQALPDEPLYVAEGGIMPLFAKAAVSAGASAIRTSSSTDIADVVDAVSVPVIGLVKRVHAGFEPFITSTLEEVQEVARAGAHVVAIDATDRPRADGRSLARLVRDIRDRHPGLEIMADISTLREGEQAADLGVDTIGTTLNGYTTQSQSKAVSNRDLVELLVSRVDVPVMAEGRIHTPEDARSMLEAGAFSVVVGGAITRPQEIAARFVEALR